MIARQLDKSDIERLIDKTAGKMKRLEIQIEEDTPASIISMDTWDWSQGVGLFSLYKYYLESGDQNVLDAIIDWFDRRLQEGLPPKNVNTMCPLLTLSYICELKTANQAQYLSVCKEWAAYAVEGLLRTPENGITHVAIDHDNSGELWADTLYMTVLFIARMGVLQGRDDYVQESIHQILVHLKYLTDKETGLFYHGWTFQERHHFAGALWGRGNAWYLAGMVDYFEIVKLPLGVEMFLISSLERQVQKLVALQAKSGMWHTLLDDPTSYEETSATAGFAYGILKAVRKGYLSEEYADVGIRAMHAVIGRIDADGAVQGVSYGTRMGRTLGFYKQIPQCPMPYGQSMTLLMLVESLHLFR